MISWFILQGILTIGIFIVYISNSGRSGGEVGMTPLAVMAFNWLNLYAFNFLIDMKFGIYILVFFLFSSCNSIEGGTHGLIKGYQYSVKKDSLEKTILSVIRSNPNIRWDEINNDDFYNDGTTYLTIKILVSQSFLSPLSLKLRADDQLYLIWGRPVAQKISEAYPNVTVIASDGFVQYGWRNGVL